MKCFKVSPVFFPAGRILLAALVLPFAGCGPGIRVDQRAADDERYQVTLEGDLRYLMTFGGIGGDGISMSPPMYFLETPGGTYILRIRPGCNLVNADDLRQQPGFEVAVQQPQSPPSGSGLVLAPTGGTRVRVRGRILDTSGMIGAQQARDFQVNYLERLPASNSPNNRRFSGNPSG